MKKIFFIFLIILIGCGGSSNNSVTPVTPITAKKILKGQAAIGSFLAVGSEVDIRPAPVNGVPCDLIITQITDDQGSYSADVSNPKTTQGQSVSSDQPAGYIIRAQNAGTWVYSYADNSGDIMTADINPYTDIMMREFYAYESQLQNVINSGINADPNIDANFPGGFFADGVTPLNIPDADTITEITTAISNIIARVYNISSIDDFITVHWAENIPLDCLLNNIYYPELQWFLNQEFLNLWNYPDVITDGAAIQGITQPFPGGNGNTITVDIWTPYGNTGNATLFYNSSTGIISVIMTKMSDSTAGNNHYQAVTPNVNTASEQCVLITIDDYQNGAGFKLAIQTQ